MTTEIKIKRTRSYRENHFPPHITRDRITFSNKIQVFLNEPEVEIDDTLSKTIITVDPLALTDKKNIIQTQGAIINQKTGKITLPTPDCSLNMTLNFSHEDESKSITIYKIKRVDLPKLD
jgi:hypothetical protein